VIKMENYNNIDYKDWKKYLGDISTDAIWITPNINNGKFIIPKRDFLPKNSSKFHGLFIPEIPYQFIQRFTKKREILWDCFGGSGTTKKVADLLNRKCIINDVNPKEEYITKGDSVNFNPGSKVQLIFMHPPYHSIIKYSNKKEDGSNHKSIPKFLDWFEKVVKNVTPYLEKNRFLILVCGNIYQNGEEQTLGVWCKDIIRKYGFKCKSHIIKDYGETKGGSKNYNLNYYRQLKGNYNSFYGDNIFILQKME
tara:strand:+ start:1392 stop:2147 length:756 start_codon:yes stop_codon:yes gene_type:complete